MLQPEPVATEAEDGTLGTDFFECYLWRSQTALWQDLVVDEQQALTWIV